MKKGESRGEEKERECREAAKILDTSAKQNDFVLIFTPLSKTEQRLTRENSGEGGSNWAEPQCKTQQCQIRETQVSIFLSLDHKAPPLPSCDCHTSTFSANKSPKLTAKPSHSKTVKFHLFSSKHPLDLLKNL